MDIGHRDAGLFAEIACAEAAEAAESEARKRLLYRAAEVLKTKEGRAILRWIVRQTGVAESVTRHDSTDMLIASARRDVGLSLIEMLREADPALTTLMIEDEIDD